jgi:hypothetical protein
VDSPPPTHFIIRTASRQGPARANPAYLDIFATSQVEIPKRPTGLLKDKNASYPSGKITSVFSTCYCTILLLRSTRAASRNIRVTAPSPICGIRAGAPRAAQMLPERPSALFAWGWVPRVWCQIRPLPPCGSTACRPPMRCRATSREQFTGHLVDPAGLRGSREWAQ